MNENINVKQLFNIVDDTNIGFKNPQRGRVYSIGGLAPALNCCEGGGLQPKIVVKETMKFKTIIGSKQEHAYRASINTISPTLTEAMGMGGGQIPLLTDATIEQSKTNNFMAQVRKQEINLPEELKGKKFRIRKLTPRECFRLMGVDDADIDKIQSTGISNSSQYKLAGNSIVVDVLYHIFRKAFIETNDENQQLSLF